MDATLLTPLNNIESSLNTLVHSLTSTNTFSAAPGAAKDLVSADEALVSALQTLKTHQDNYQRILKLRAEADRLNERLKDIVRTCVNFRKEIGDIHPSILEDSDEEDAEEDSTTQVAQEVDYENLLSFAARIGKHNALASRAADEEATRRKVEAIRKREQNKNQHQQQQDVNGGGVPGGLDAENPNNILTQESQANLAAIDNDLAAQRAYMGQAFPAADRLRMGALGQLQLLQERSGEEEVDREIERMVKESELGMSVAARPQTEVAVPGLEETMRMDKRPSESAVSAGASAAVRTAQRRQSVVQPPQKKKVLDLDFPGSDDEDED